MRLAGTAIQYSMRAMAQLAITAIHMGAEGNFRWPYQAVVMKRLEPTSKRIGSTAGDKSGIEILVWFRRGMRLSSATRSGDSPMPNRAIVTAALLVLTTAPVFAEEIGCEGVFNQNATLADF